MITEQPLLLLKLQRKLYFNFPIRNMLQTNFSHAILLREGVMSRDRIIHRLRTSMLDTLEIVSRNHFFKFYICILWLNGAVLPLNIEEDLISSRT